MKYLKFKMVMTRNVCYSQFSRSRHSVSPFILRRSELLFLRVFFFFFTYILTKLTDGTVCLVCPEMEWHYMLIGTSRQSTALFVYFFFLFFRLENKRARQARSGSHAPPVVRDVRSSLASRLPPLA